MDLNQKKKNRYLFLHLLYKDSDGDTDAWFDMWEVGNELHFERNETSRIVDYLTSENLIEPRALGGAISLTHWGIKEVEEALEHPNKPTEHFLPINIINIGSMTNSTLQQATNHSTINFSLENKKPEALDDIIIALNDIKDKLSLPADLRHELVSEIQTLEIQKQSPKPKSIIISESLKSLKTILEGITGGVAAPFIVEKITHFLAG